MYVAPRFNVSLLPYNIKFIVNIVMRMENIKCLVVVVYDLIFFFFLWNSDENISIRYSLRPYAVNA